MTISETILAQLGGQRFKAMTGAKNFSHNDSMLAFQLPRGTTKNKAVQVYIHYEAGKDLYEISFYRFKRDYTPVEIEIISDLDAQAMRDVFVNRTGLYLSM